MFGLEAFLNHNNSIFKKLNYYTAENVKLQEKIEELLEENRRLIQELRKGEENLLFAGTNSIYKYRFFHELLKKEFSRSLRTHQPFTLLSIGIDNLNIFRQENGYLSVELLFYRLGELILRCIRKMDSSGQMDNNTYLVLCPQISRDIARKIGSRIKNSVEHSYFPVAGNQKTVTASIGIVDFAQVNQQPFPIAPEEIINQACLAQQKARDSGGNRIEFYSP